MREMFRVLRPGGVAFVRVAAYEWMRSGHDEALGTQRRYKLAQLVERMERAGFRVRRATYANALLLPAAAVRRLVLKPLGLADGGSDVKPLPQGLALAEPPARLGARGRGESAQTPRRESARRTLGHMRGGEAFAS
jgi:hypothetical protein